MCSNRLKSLIKPLKKILNFLISSYLQMESSSPSLSDRSSPNLSLSLPTKKISKKTYNKSRLLALKSKSTVPHCKYKFIFDPAKLLNPFTTHQLEGDLFLNCDNNSNDKLSQEDFKGLLYNFNCCKQPMSAIHDKNLRVVIFKVESHETVMTPIEMMVNKLDSLGDKHAHELAETVKYYGFSLEFMRNLQLAEDLPAKNHSLFKDYQGKIKKILETYQDNGFVFSTKTKFSALAKRLEVTEISFNENFVNTLDLSMPKFIQKTLKKGFPDVVDIAGNYHEWYCQILQMTGMAENDNKTPRMCVFWGKNKTMAIKCQVLVENVLLKMDNYMENTMFFICVPKGLNYALEEGVPLGINEANFKKKELGLAKYEDLEEWGLPKLQNRRICSEFLKKFYPEALREEEKEDLI